MPGNGELLDALYTGETGAVPSRRDDRREQPPEAALESGEVRAELTLEQILDMVGAIAQIPGDPGYREPILRPCSMRCDLPGEHTNARLTC